MWYNYLNRKMVNCCDFAHIIWNVKDSDNNFGVIFAPQRFLWLIFPFRNLLINRLVILIEKLKLHTNIKKCMKMLIFVAKVCEFHNCFLQYAEGIQWDYGRGKIMFLDLYLLLKQRDCLCQRWIHISEFSINQKGFEFFFFLANISIHCHFLA